MVTRTGLTRPEMAARYKVSERTVRRWCAEPDWPAPIGKRGKFEEYDREQADAAAARRQQRAEPVDAGPRLLTTTEIAQLYHLDPGTVRGYASSTARNILGDPDAVRDGVKLYRADRVAVIMAGRRRYRRIPA